MEYNITLDLITYIIVLIAFGTIGSCYQAYKDQGTTKPFWARVICGAFAGSVTMLVVFVLGLEGTQAFIHFGIAALLGLLSERGETGRIVDLIFNRGGKP